MLKHFMLIFTTLLLLSSTLYAIEDNDLPEDMLEWKAWVLEGLEQRECPINYQKNTPQCTWYEKVEIVQSADTLNYTMKVKLYANQTAVYLPVMHQSWAKDVLVNGQKAIVIGEDERPAIILDIGEYEITGSFSLKKDVKYVALSPAVALVSFRKEGQNVLNPKVDQQGRLWLENNQESQSSEGTLVVSMYRKVVDNHPLKMQTYLQFRVSGEMRTVELDGVLLDGFLPLGVKSVLHTTMTKNQNLKVEVKAGEWEVVIDSYHPEPISSLHLPKYAFDYANEELWSLQSSTNYRTIEIEGVTSIDPSQTPLPEAWKSLPAYLVQENQTFTIKELYKSAKQQQKSAFSLKRQMWLDFEGGGYTIDDTIQAKISTVQRLETTPHLALASATINGNPALITTVKENREKGIELRESDMNIQTSSRYEGAINGWSEQFDSIQTQLHLPPGWELFAAFGSDNRSSAWLEKWSLMDIFLVLLLVIAIYQLYGWKWAVPATLFIVLFWHESDAPNMIWLLLVVLIAILRVVVDGRLKKFLQFFTALVVAVALLQVFSFSVYEIRTALYPQLEQEHYNTSRFYDNEDTYGYSNISKESLKQYAPRKMQSIKQEQQEYKMMQNRIDPNAVVQTGIGKPSWSWKSYHFSWQSGVGSDDRLELWLLSPWMVKLLKIMNIAGMFFLLYLFLREFGKGFIPKLKTGLMQKSVSSFAIVLVLGMFSPQSLKADIPSPELLAELKERLVETPKCLPNCAQISEANVSIVEDKLVINLNIAVGTHVSVPLLANRNVWLPEKVMVNQIEAKALALGEGGELFVVLEKGVHDVRLVGTLKGKDQVVLNSRLRLHNLELNSQNPLWKLNSDFKSYVEINSLKEVRESIKEQNSIKPLIEVKRTFYFGQHWYVDTEVKLLNTIEKPYRLRYPLLNDESILDKKIETQNHHAILQMSNKDSYTWRSSLPITTSLVLEAMKRDEVIEIWQMDISTIWDMHYEGLEPIEQYRGYDVIMPRFKPWQGEHLKLTLEKTKAVKGENLTIESSQLKMSQSGRYRDVSLELRMVSAKATQYPIRIEGIETLKPTIIDGRTHYLKISDDVVTIPLHAKAQTVKLSWREEMSSETSYVFSSIDLKKASTNNEIKLTLPSNRWILWTDGPTLGPAVLLWGVILALLIVAFVLGKVKGSPLKTQDWLLLGIGVSTTSVMILLPIVIWIFALRYREYRGDELVAWKRNLTQVGLVILTFIALGTIVGAVSSGLLGNPDMIIAGNSSYGNYLNWYSDRISGVVPEPTVFSISIWYYRALMLLWSIWVAFALIRWLKWAWAVFSQGEMWSQWRVEKPSIKES